MKMFKKILYHAIQFMCIAAAFMAFWMLHGVVENILFIVPVVLFGGLAVFFYKLIY